VADRSTSRYYASLRSATYDDRDPLLRQLRLRAQSPRCEGTTAKADWRRCRTRPLKRRGVRDIRQRAAQVFQEGTRPVSDGCRDWSAGERL